MKSIKAKIEAAERKVLDAGNKLSATLEELSILVSDLTGEAIAAEFCDGNEIEYRRGRDSEDIDDMECMRTDDILEICERNNK